MATPGSGSLESLRERNRRRVIDALRRNGTASRADLARHTGLSRTTVSSLVADLQAGGWIVEREDDSGRAAQQGRPPVLLALDAAAGAVVGIDFGHAHVRVAIADLSRAILAERLRLLDIDHAAEQALGAAVELVDEVVEESGLPHGRVLGAGVGLSGPIDHEHGMMHGAQILPGWVGLRPAALLEERLGLPVFLDNDANLGALAEVTMGAGVGAREAVYLMISSGIGAGIIIDGELHRGARGTAGELGHVLVDESGPICRCGNRGCLETLAAGPAIVELLRRSHGTGLTLADVLRLAGEGDPGVGRAIADAGRIVGRTVAALCNVLNPELIIVGGDVAAAGELLLGPLREAVHRYAIPTAADDVRVVAGVLGERAEVLGALALAARRSDVPTPEAVA